MRCRPANRGTAQDPGWSSTGLVKYWAGQVLGWASTGLGKYWAGQVLGWSVCPCHVGFEVLD